MINARRGVLLIVLLGIAGVIVAAYVVLVEHPEHVVPLQTLAALVLPIAVPVIPVLWRRIVPRRDPAPELIDRAVDRLADQIRVGVESDLEQRGLRVPAPIPLGWKWSKRDLGVSRAAAVDPTWTEHRAAPLPGMSATGQGELESGSLADLFQVYGGVASGRMVLLGDAGAGKTSAALQLVLSALNHRRSLDPDDQARTPVPVMLGLHDWDPGQLDFLSWATSQVLHAYPFLRSADYGPGVVRKMLANGRVSFVLDSLDAVPPRLRPAVLQKLNALTAQRVVLLSRGDEMGDAAARRGLLIGAATLELTPPTAAQAADYLASFPGTPTTTWQRLLRLLQGGSRGGLIKALQNPLMLSLVADLHGREDRLGELLNRRSRKAAEEYLLDTILLNAYGRDPDTDGPLPPYTVDQARRWLGRLAMRLDETGDRDVAWWRVRGWLPLITQLSLTIYVSALIGTIVWGMLFVIGDGATTPIASGIASGLLIGMPAGLLLHQGGDLMFGSTSGEPRAWAVNRLRSLAAPSVVLGWLMLAGAEFALIRLRLTYFPEPGEDAPSPIHTLVVSAAFTLALMIVYAGARPTGTDRSTADPWTCWKRDLGCGLLIGAVLGLGGILALSAGVPSARGIAFNLAFGLGFGVTVSRVWRALLVFVWLRVAGDGPLRMMHFLEDARARHVLRTVGPRYQFRHARLQDRLAMQATRD
ncbi:hypothetical protein AB0I95_03055 [Micromonospora sp. NPDC049751]|uniref:hypothetical protein n=1 Tax=Micromonospora sp. NPDC049751 TaxID=3154837 RepID=UPI0033E8E5FF